MKPSEKKLIKEIVKVRISELQEILNLTEGSSKTVILDQTAAGRVSRIDAIQQQKMAVSSLVRDKKLLARLEVVLQLLSSNDIKVSDRFGRCEECDEIISFARLKIKPESEYCIECQSSIEKM